MDDLEGVRGAEPGEFNVATLAKEGLAMGQRGEQGGHGGAQGAALGTDKTVGGSMAAEATARACITKVKANSAAVPPKAGGSSSS